MEVELYKSSDAKDYRAVYAELKDDELVISTHDMGAKVEEFWGRDEYEFWATVPKKAWGELAIGFYTVLFKLRRGLYPKLVSYVNDCETGLFAFLRKRPYPLFDLPSQTANRTPSARIPIPQRETLRKHVRRHVLQ